LIDRGFFFGNLLAKKKDSTSEKLLNPSDSKAKLPEIIPPITYATLILI
jgi:hypothetical protein